MYFAINGRAVYHPETILQICETHGYDTSSWYGKANSFVDRRGVDPSYGYFLIDYPTVQSLSQVVGNTENPYGGTEGSRLGTLKIQYDEKLTETTYKTRVMEDLLVENLINVTPSLLPNKSIYLVKLCDARLALTETDTSVFKSPYGPVEMLNGVIGFASPTQLKTSLNLHETPTKGRFVYTPDSVKDEPEANPIGIDYDTGANVYYHQQPYSWKECIEQVIMVGGREGTVQENNDPIFPYYFPKGGTRTATLPNYFTKPDWVLEIYYDSKVELPQYVPQNIDLFNYSPRELLYLLLYHINADIIYHGKGKFEVVDVSNDSKTYVGPNGANVNGSQFSELYSKLNRVGSNKKTIIADGETTTALGHPLYALPPMRGERISNYYSTKVEFIDLMAVDANSNEIADRLEKTKERVYENPDAVVGKTVRDIHVPIVYTAARYNSNSTNHEYFEDYDIILTLLSDIARKENRRILQYPCVSYDLLGAFDIKPTGFVERVSIYQGAHEVPRTKIENILPVKYDLLKPKVPIFNQNELVVVKGKVLSDVTPETASFNFEVLKVIIGSVPPTTTFESFNTYLEYYQENEEVIFIFSPGGVEMDSVITGNTISTDDAWNVLVPKTYQVLKFNTADLDTAIRDGINTAETIEVPLSVVTTVTGRKPFDEDDTAKIKITPNPTVILDAEENKDIYIRYDESIGDDVLSHWTTADAGNYLAHLKGIGDYTVKDPESHFEPEIVGHWAEEPSNTPAMAWKKLEEILVLLQMFDPDDTDQFIGHDGEKAIWKNPIGTGSGGGGGYTPGMVIEGEGGGTTIHVCVASVDAASGRSSAQTVDVDGAVALVGTAPSGTVTTTNTLGRPYWDDEKVIIISKNGSNWYIIKSGLNMLRATVSGEVFSADSTGSFGSATAVYGVGPSSGTFQNVHSKELASGDGIVLVQNYSNQWIPISYTYNQTAIFYTSSTIVAASISGADLTAGTGTAKLCTRTAGLPNKYTGTGSNITIYNIVPFTVGINKFVQCKRIGSRWFVDVEACG